MATQSRYEYDVFLSFRGEDVRKTFVDHLRRALDQRGIRAFKDDSDRDLPRGKAISPELIRAIEESRYVLVVFSENYASSSWCLEEIAKIVECKDLSAGSVIPIFYHVNPSDIRKIKGSFEKHFAKHEEYYKNNSQVLKKWKDALNTVADLSGENLSDGHESEFIQKVTDEIEIRLGRRFSYVAGELVGIESRVAEVVEKLCLSKSDVRSIGIWGMGGIGKTTTARAIYNRIHSQFEGSCFIANIREVLEKNGLVHIQNQLLHNILKDSKLSAQDVHEGANMIKERLQYKKVILVLDDVDKPEQLEGLAGGLDWFGKGSRIIITTRNKHLLKQYRENYTYRVEGLTNEEALKFFSLNAFKCNYPPYEFSSLSQEVVKYANGLPLALKVLGSSLVERNLVLWKSTLAQLKNFPRRDIYNQLKISYDGLEDPEKEIFLDIACFFKGREENDVVKYEESCGLDPKIGIEVLFEKSLIRREDNKLQMHDLLQEMGRKIVYEESRNEPGYRSRIWRLEDICHVLTNNSGSANVKGIILTCHTGLMGTSIEEFLRFIELEKSRAKKARKTISRGSRRKGRGNDVGMTNLRFLIVDSDHPFSTLKLLSNELRLLEWRNCTLESFPPDFYPRDLVELNMRDSSMKNLWRGKKVFKKLKVIDLSCSLSFEETPDFQTVPNLERLILTFCHRLYEVHPSIGDLQNLTLLDLCFCKNLKSLPESISRLSNLTELDMSWCDLQEGEIPIIIGCLSSLRSLDLCHNNFTTIPKSICDIHGLMILKISGCKNVEALPESIFYVEAYSCSRLKRLSNPFITWPYDGRFVNCYSFLPESLGLTWEQKYYLSSFRYIIWCSVMERCCSYEKFSSCYYVTDERHCFNVTEGDDLTTVSRSPCMISPSDHGIPEWFRFKVNGSFLRVEMPPQWFNEYWSGFAIYASFKWQNGDSFRVLEDPPTLFCYLSGGGVFLQDTLRGCIHFMDSGFLWLGFPPNRRFLNSEFWEAITGSSHVNFRLSTSDDRFVVEKFGVHPVYKQNPADFDALLTRWTSSLPQDWRGICHELHNSIPMREDQATPLIDEEDLFRAFKPAFRKDVVDCLIFKAIDESHYTDWPTRSCIQDVGENISISKQNVSFFRSLQWCSYN